VTKQNKNRSISQ